MESKQISVSEFKAHCAEELRKVENGGISLQLTRHGKVVAEVHAPASKLSADEPKTLQEFIGSLRNVPSGVRGADFDNPTFAPEDWEKHPANVIMP